MDANSRTVSSNQTDLHPRLAALVRRHLAEPFRKPVAAHTAAAFAEATAWRDWRPLLLDAGCGSGAGTLALARRFADVQVLGVDRSARRLAKTAGLPSNALLLRADLADFWRLAAAAGWRLWRHYLLYPNPWPKAKHVQRRWHGSPFLPFILQLGGRLELRSNWRLYVEEWAAALRLAGCEATVEPYRAEAPLTPFERKYWASGQRSWRCAVDLNTTSSTPTTTPAKTAPS